MELNEVVLLTPKNDEESLMIVKIATRAGIPLLVSDQPHGARLAEEPELIARVKQANAQARTVVIVEIPGEAQEAELKVAGLEVVIIDHHRYDGLDRMQYKSSLEQFLEFFCIADDRLVELGFDPIMVRGVGLMDRGFVWELAKEGVDPVTARRIREFYLSLAVELKGERLEEKEEAKNVWEKREERDGLIILRTDREDLGLRELLSFIIADNFERPPQVIFIQGKRRMTVQDSDATPRLHRKFGGFVFGQDRCWGFAAEAGKELPNLEEVIATIVE